MSEPETCRNGHPRTVESTYVYPNGRRECIECRRARWRRWWHANYGGEYAERHRQRYRERYFGDPEFRDRVLDRNLKRYNARANEKDDEAIRLIVEANPWLADIRQLIGYI
jgi:hypothetical protein